MINILTDSTADIPKELCEAYHIDTIPMYIQVDGKVYKDGEEIVPAMLFETVRKTGQFPTTSAPPPGDFLKFFDRNDPSIYIGVSGKLSTTYRNAQLALNEMGNKMIDLIDSLSISTGYGQVVLQAAKWRDEGIGFQELGQRIRERISKTRGFFILDTLDYIYHGGRCSAIEHFFSTMLKIRPVLQILPDGTLGVLQKVRGSREKAVKALLAYFKEQLFICEIPEIYVTHLDCNEEAEFLVEQIKAFGKPVEIKTASVGCVLATHSGPKPIGIAYHIK
jgi:DegV family protein with EDD domain